jgi:hypothetical protein
LVDPGEYCNGKKTVTIRFHEWADSTQYIDDDLLELIEERNDDFEELRESEAQEHRTYFEGYCNAEAGKGTENFGEGRCQHHGGSAHESDDAGAPAHNQNGQKTAANVDPHHYAENLPEDEEEFVKATSESILDRVRRNHGREPDFLDEILARRVAINLHIVSKASEYTRDELVQVIVHENGSHEEKGALVEEVRRYSNSIMSNLKELGVMDDPESQKADELAQWRDYVESGESEDKSEVIDVESEEVSEEEETSD